jgi:acetyl-CoA synthetase
VTAYYWQNLSDADIHIAVADTGWAKAGWGQDVRANGFAGRRCSCTILTASWRADLLERLSKYRVTSFCAPRRCTVS